MKQDELNLLNELLEVDEGLTGWEIEFIEDLNRRRRFRSLSRRQKEALNRIAEKVGLGGLI